MDMGNRIISNKFAGILAISISLSSISTEVSAQSDVDAINACLEAITQNDNERVQDLASLIPDMRNVPRFLQGDALQCLVTATTEDWQYLPDASRFVRAAEVNEMLSELAATEEEEERLEAAREMAEIEAVNQRICELRDIVAATNRTLQEAEAAKQDRRIETLAATIQECSAWFEDDARRALTNNICNSIFASGGLPNSEILGPTTSEALLAEVINTNAKTELEIVIESGMLLETIAAIAAEMGISETAVSYNCDP